MGIPSTVRRALLLGVCTCLAGAAVAQDPPLRVDGARLNATMERMKDFGGTLTGGSMRVAYSEANRDALDYLAGLMRDAGLQTRIDAAGNLIGRRPGAEAALAPLMIGSHVDTVPNGGHYDGVVGVMAAVEVAKTLHDAGIALRHPLEVIVWSNEEGGKTGSRAMMGSVESLEFELPSLGDRTLGEGMRFLGGDPDAIDEVRRAPGDAAGYLELHIEQGAILDRRDIDIGVVQGIVGIRRWNVTVEGVTNHAGTTPMDQRQDALYAAARLVAVIRDEITAEAGAQVGTVGRIRAFPGAPNVIPGSVTMSLEIRDLAMDKIRRLFGRIASASEALARETATTVRFDPFYESPAALTDERWRERVTASAEAGGLSTLAMPSGAGHDAQSLAGICPIGMIFVPSRDGVSHAPSEYTSPEDIENGANVLLATLRMADADFD